jgi:flagellar basal-body rod protein FlgC
MAGLLSSIEISSRGLSVQRAKMNVVADNIANAQTIETEKGGPYRRQRVIVKQDKVQGSFNSALRNARVNLVGTDKGHMKGRSFKVGRREEFSVAKMEVITDPESSYRLVHDPSHPNANEDGYVRMPDIEIINEMVDMMIATRAYEANTVAIASAKKMAKDALDI